MTALCGALDAHAFNVTGTITDSAANPIPGIKVDIFDDDGLLDDHLATVYTNNLGQYAATITSGYGPENPDIYLVVDWKFQLLPAASYGNHHINLVSKVRSNTAAGTYTLLTSFTPQTSATTTDHDPATDLTVNQAMGQALAPPPGGLDDLVNLRLHINEALDYYRNNKGTVTWSWNEDVNLNIITSDRTSFFYHLPLIAGQPAPNINICQVDINGTAQAGVGQGFVSDIYHEMGHLVHYRFNGDSLPSGAFSGSHNVDTESDPPFAIVEAWPSYVAELTDDPLGNDNKYRDYRDDGSNGVNPPNTLWRGGTAIDNDVASGLRAQEASPTGYHGNVFESGEDVEGAVGGVWFGIDADPLFTNFESNFRIMVTKKPNHIFDFAKGFAATAGSGTAETKRLHGILQQHGIIFSRPRFSGNPFSAPLSTASGGAKEIDGVMYLRGTVKTKFEEVSATDLGVDQKLSVGRVRVKYKLSNPDLSGKPSDFPAGNQTPYVSFGFFSHELDLDTTILGDGEWDLLLTGENDEGFEDNLLPTWAPNPAAAPADPGDGTAAVNTEEKYLKVLGPWYDKDRDPTTNQVDEGKVIVDNTAPTVQIRKSP
jgi:hypothetical protein